VQSLRRNPQDAAIFILKISRSHLAQPSQLAKLAIPLKSGAIRDFQRHAVAEREKSSTPASSIHLGFSEAQALL
jgi:hypothetical protein